MTNHSQEKPVEESTSPAQEYPTRVIVKFDDELDQPYEAGAERALKEIGINYDWRPWQSIHFG